MILKRVETFIFMKIQSIATLTVRTLIKSIIWSRSNNMRYILICPISQDFLLLGAL